MAEHQEGPEGHEHRIEILVNDCAVTVEEHKQTGLSIKEAAIHQKVPIERDFALSIERGGKQEPVADEQEIEVHKGERFLAVHHDHRIDVVVNEKPVVLDGHKQTGLSIKQAAIAQNVPIELDFVISIERAGGKTEVIRDDEKISVHKHERFLAIPNDDNS